LIFGTFPRTLKSLAKRIFCKENKEFFKFRHPEEGIDFVQILSYFKHEQEQEQEHDAFKHNKGITSTTITCNQHRLFFSKRDDKFTYKFK
jgi:hypothetical protein